MTTVGREKISQLMDCLRRRVDDEQVRSQRLDRASDRRDVVDGRRSQAGSQARTPGHDRRLRRQHDAGPFRPLGDPLGRRSVIVSQVVPRLSSLQNRSLQRTRHARPIFNRHAPLASGFALLIDPPDFDSSSADRVAGQRRDNGSGQQTNFASVFSQGFDMS